MNIATHLASMALQHPLQDAIIVTSGIQKSERFHVERLGYQALHHDSDKLAKALLSAGFEPGRRAVLMVPPSFELFIITFALFKAGIIPVFIDPGMGFKNLKDCLRDAEPHYFIAIPKAHAARHLLGWQRRKLLKTIAVGGARLGCDYSYHELLHQPAAESAELIDHPDSAPAAILFTSGSTGTPKGVHYSHGNFNAQITALREAFAIEPGEIDLCTFPLFALFAPALGMTAVIPEMDFTKPARANPTAIFRAIAHFKATNVFGSPALLKRLAEAEDAARFDLSSLRRMISAGAPVPTPTLQAVSKILPLETPIYTPYGATEALPVAICSSELLLSSSIIEKTRTGAGVCVGTPAASINLKIIKISDQVISSLGAAAECATGEIGEIIVQGPQVTSSYFNRDTAGRLAKIRDGSEFYHRMGDLGYLDEAGQLWFCGRKAHRIERNDRSPIFTIPGESIFNADERISRTALVAAGSKTVLCVELRRPLKGPAKQRLTADIMRTAKRFAQTSSIESVLYHRSFPVDVRHNSKIFREKLAIWAEKELRN